MSNTVTEDHLRCDIFLQELLKNLPGPKPCCFKGCSACCSEPVYVSSAEVEDIVTHLSDEQKDVIKEKLLVWIEKTKGILGEKMPAAVKYRALNAVCPFLKDGLCSIYERRPTSCRAWYATGKPEDCELPAREHQQFATIPEQIHPFIGVQARLNGEITTDHFGVLLAQRLLGIKIKSASRKHFDQFTVMKMLKVSGR
jgi:Fe-S-cluster containining protein